MAGILVAGLVALALTLALRTLVGPIWRASSSPLQISPGTVVDVELAADATVTKTFKVVNRGSMPISLIGTKQTCGCMVSDGLPSDLEPGQCATIAFRLSGAGLDAGSAITRSSYLLTDQTGLMPRFDFHLVAKVPSPK